MKYLAVTIAAGVGMAAFFGIPAYGGSLYPIAPPGNSVYLQRGDFIHSVPQSSGVVYPGIGGTVIGDNLYQHPGATLFDPSAYLIGVFGNSIDTYNPDTNVYVWESGGGSVGNPPFAIPGPDALLGFWDGTTFTSYGNSVEASYQNTGVEFPNDPFDEKFIYSSVIPLSDFHITGNPILNAVMISHAAVGDGDNRTTAVAANTVPEPSTLLLVGTGLASLFVVGWQQRKQVYN